MGPLDADFGLSSAAYASPEPVAVAALSPADAGPRALESPVLLGQRALEHLAVRGRGRFALGRLIEMLPALVALTVISSLVWGPLLAPLPFIAGVLAFHVFWTYRAQMNGAHAVKGYLMIRRHKNTDWRQRYEEHRAQGNPCLEWDDVRHIVIVPNYTESAEKLRMGLDSLAASEQADRIFVVLAMEEREGEEGRRKAALLEREYEGRVGMIFAAFHPWGLPGEVVGKSSNENWAARRARERLVDRGGLNIDHLTITSCDADTVFDPKYFSCLTYKFATDADRYRKFWQGPIFFYNNIWDVPAPLRMAHSLASFNQVARLSRSFMRMVFPQSTYSLSLRMADEAGYWDPDIIPEDWHMFLKCYYRFGGAVDVETMYTPLYMDGVRSHSYLHTFWNYYEQSRRHAWGCTDISYAAGQTLDHPEIPLRARLRRLWAVSESHFLWSTQWFLITVSKVVPFFVAATFGTHVPLWYPLVSYWIMLPCLSTLLLILYLDAKMRPERPRNFGRWLYPVQYGQYFLMAVITFFSTALPALDAQARLALGKRLEYRVTEKA